MAAGVEDYLHLFHLHLSHMPVESPSVGNGFFLFFEQLRSLFRGRRFEAFVSHFVVDVVFKGQARLFGVYDERVFALFRKLGVVSHEHPVARVYRFFLLVKSFDHVYAVRYAVAVGDYY